MVRVLFDDGRAGAGSDVHVQVGRKLLSVCRSREPQARIVQLRWQSGSRTESSEKSRTTRLILHSQKKIQN